MSVAGVGVVRFWGFSEALDLLDEVTDAGGEVNESEVADPLRFLMVCPGDVRHVIKTLAGAHMRRTEGGKPARAFEACVYEKEPEVLARHALLLSVALDFELPRRERAELLLELWANSLLREKTATYLAAKARELSRLVSEGEGPLAPLIDVSALKMKDRDRLEEVFRSWAEDVDFDMVRLRDERLRAFYKTRYDARANVLDWDYTWELSPIASIVHKLHFRDWRLNGVLFEVRDSAYVAPNRTLASYAYGREKGSSIARRGYWGDVANGPFAAMGVTCDEERLTVKRSDRHIKSSNDIAYYTMLQWLSELEAGKRWGLKQEDIQDFEYGASVKGGGGFARGFLSGGSKLEALVEEPAVVDDDDDAGGGGVVDVEEEARASAARAKVCAAKLARLPRFKLKLLCGDWGDVLKKPRHRGAFDALTLATHVAYLVADRRTNTLLRPRAAASLETAKFLVELRKDSRKEYAVKLHAAALALGWAAGKGLSLGDDGAVDGVGSAILRYDYDEAAAAVHLEKIKDAPPPPAEPLQLTDESGEGAADEAGAGVGSPGSDGDGRPTGGADGAAAGVGCLQIVEKDDGAATADGTPQGPAPAAPPVVLPGGATVGGGDGKAAAELAAAPGGRVCVITGLPAKYKDPLTGLPYANLDAYKELRRRHPDPNKPPPPPEGEAKEGGGEAEGAPNEPPPERLRPILTGGMGRRVNKAVAIS